MEEKKHSSYSPQKAFKEFLEDKKIPYNSLLGVYFGAWLVTLFTAFYSGALKISALFGNIFSIEIFFVFWLVIIGISFYTKKREFLSKAFVYINNFILIGLFAYMMLLSPTFWPPMAVELALLLLLILNWMGANLYSPWGILGTALFSLFWFVIFATYNFSVFETQAQTLSAVYLLVYFIVLPAMFFWNSSRTKKFLWKEFQQKEQLKETAQVTKVRIKARTRQLQQQAKNLKQANQTKSEVLRERIEELERFKDVTVERELKMIELKKKIKELKEEIKRLKNNNNEK